MNSPKGYPVARATGAAYETISLAKLSPNSGQTSNYNQAFAGFCLQIAD